MPNVSVNFTTKKQTVPAAAGVSRSFQVSLMNGDQVVSSTKVTLPASSALFPPPPDGTYVAKAQPLTTDNQPFGDPAVSEPFTVVNTVEVDVPDIVTVTLG